MKKAFCLILVLAALLLLFSCKSGEKALTPVTVTLDWTPNTNHSGLYAALEHGLYKREGLDVRIIQPGQSTTIQMVATGQSEIGVSYQEDVIRARVEGFPVVSVAAVIQHNTSGFASLKSTGITSPKDFEGKRYGAVPWPSELAVLQAVMQKAGADFSKVKVVYGIADFFSTIGRDADFEWIYEGWDGVEARLRGLEMNYLPLRDLEPALDYYTPVLVTNEEQIRNRPELLQSFMQATSEGYEFCIANPDSAANILLKHAPELKPELVRASQKYLSDKYRAESPRWGVQKPEVWQGFTDWMFAQKLLSRPPDITKAYTNEFLPQERKR